MCYNKYRELFVLYTSQKSYTFWNHGLNIGRRFMERQQGSIDHRIVSGIKRMSAANAPIFGQIAVLEEQMSDENFADRLWAFTLGTNETLPAASTKKSGIEDWEK